MFAALSLADAKSVWVDAPAGAPVAEIPLAEVLAWVAFYAKRAQELERLTRVKPKKK